MAVSSIRAGRLSREQAATQELYEALSFDLRDIDDYVEHLEAIEKEALNDVAAAEARLHQARERLTRIRTNTNELRRHLHADRMAVIEWGARNGFAHQIRPETKGEANGALAALAARTNGRAY